ncbi:MAG TPA: hypothetical protein VKY74_18890 [Chloroflexia bacterium]|nr:hypothetical protein [Chloroflexia bacterium]
MAKPRVTDEPRAVVGPLRPAEPPKPHRGRGHRRAALALATLFLAGSIGPGPTVAAALSTPLVGTWGLAHTLIGRPPSFDAILAAAGPQGANLAFPCGNGHIPGAILVDACGRFDVEGTISGDVYTTSGAHGSRPDGPTPAHYTGWIISDTLYLVVESPQSKSYQVRGYTLTRIAAQPSPVPVSTCP